MASLDDVSLNLIQIGTVGWQRKGEFTSGSGILHETHHRCFQSRGHLCTSIFPSSPGAAAVNAVNAAEVEEEEEDDDDDDIIVIDSKGEPMVFTSTPQSNRRFDEVPIDVFYEYRSKLTQQLLTTLKQCEIRHHKKVDAIIAHHAFVNVMAAVEIKRNLSHNMKLIAFVHGTELKMFQRQSAHHFHAMMLPFLTGVDDWIVISQNEFDLFCQTFPQVPISKIHLVPNGIDVDLFQPPPSSKETPTTPGNQILPKQICDHSYDHIVVNAGKFVEWKRLDSLIDAASIYEQWGSDNGINILTVICGTGPSHLVKAYHDQATKHCKNVLFLGSTEHMVLAEIYRAASVGCFPAHCEPMGLVILEALSCGTPVIVADSGGPKDFVSKDVGVRVPETESHNDFVDSIASAIQESISDHWKKLKGTKCRELILDKYTVIQQIQVLEKIIQG